MNTTSQACSLAGAADRPLGRELQWAAAVVAMIVCVASPVVMPGWPSMLLNCAAMFAALKFLVWTAAPRATASASAHQRLAFFLLWPGLDAPAFLDSRRIDSSLPGWQEWCGAALKTATAVALIWGAVRWISDADPWLVGLAGMLAFVLLLHSGLFHLAALAWRWAGRAVEPIMNQPLHAKSLADFWGRRWNLAFRDAASLLIFRPLAHRFGVRVAAVGAFLFSGLVHEAAISLPARGGYGLPTLYFFLQVLGIGLQRSWLRGEKAPAWAAQLTTAIVVVGPVPLLFHRAFAERVIVPLLQAIGAL